MYGLNQNNNDLVLFLRFKDIFTTYHSVIYDSSYNCISYLISYKTTNSSIKYGQIIIFYKYHDQYYAYVQLYEDTKQSINDYVQVRKEMKPKLNEIFPIRCLSKTFVSIPVHKIYHKCIEVKYSEYSFISEVRGDQEHD